jgi:pimeloyl-ACP methyl ester carboxylesterase
MRCSARGKGEAVLLIHGMPTNGRLWDGVVHQLARHFRCFAVDLPGMGSTEFLPYSATYFAQVAEQIEQIRIRNRVQRWHVVGHDGGCAVAVQYAHLFPKRAGCMALLSPAIFPDLEPFFLLELLRKPVIGECVAPIVHALFWQIAMRRAIPDSQCASQRSSFYETFSGVFGPWKLMRLVRWGRPEIVFQDFPSILRKLLCPTLLIHGTRDILPESFAGRAAEMIPNSRLLEVNSGHFIPLDRAVEVSHHLLAYFTSHGVEIAAKSGPAYREALRGGAAKPELVPVPAAN